MSGVTLAGLFQDLKQRFAGASLHHPAADARILIAGLLGLSQTAFLSEPERLISTEDAARVDAAALRRLNREPVHRILGRREFYGLDFELSPETLEPRPDTEVLVEHILPHLSRIAARKGEARVLDLGTGTGAILLSLLKECPAATGTGVDISENALATATRNAGLLGLAARFTAIRSNWGEAVATRFDVIVSNPPYIPSRVVDALAPEVRLFDPRAALDGGEDGLDAYRRIALDAPGLLAADGIVALEIGFDQRLDVTDLMSRAGFALLEQACDYGGNDRVLIFTGHKGQA